MRVKLLAEKLGNPKGSVLPYVPEPIAEQWIREKVAVEVTDDDPPPEPEPRKKQVKSAPKNKMVSEPAVDKGT